MQSFPKLPYAGVVESESFKPVGVERDPGFCRIVGYRRTCLTMELIVWRCSVWCAVAADREQLTPTESRSVNMRKAGSVPGAGGRCSLTSKRRTLIRLQSTVDDASHSLCGWWLIPPTTEWSTYLSNYCVGLIHTDIRGPQRMYPANSGYPTCGCGCSNWKQLCVKTMRESAFEGACCSRYKQHDARRSWKSTLSNRSVSLTDYQTPKHFTSLLWEMFTAAVTSSFSEKQWLSGKVVSVTYSIF